MSGQSGDSVEHMYVSTPVKAISSAFQVERIIERGPRQLWKEVKDAACLTRAEFDDYYNGASGGSRREKSIR